jgi:hypothetical protein
MARLLATLTARLQAVGRLAVTLTWSDGRMTPGGHTFSTPTAAPETLRLALANTLERLYARHLPASAPVGAPAEAPYLGAVEAVLTLGGITDEPAQQLSLLDFAPTPRETLVATLDRLAARYGREAFHMAVLDDPYNPLPERRVTWKGFG